MMREGIALKKEQDELAKVKQAHVSMSKEEQMAHSMDESMSHMDHKNMDHATHEGMNHMNMDHAMHEGMDHMNMDHDMHGGMDHSMHMGNFKQKFWLSLIVAIPIVLMSPMMGSRYHFNFNFQDQTGSYLSWLLFYSFMAGSRF